MSKLANAYRDRAVRVNESEAEKLVRAYLYWRTPNNGHSRSYSFAAHAALLKARVDVANGTSRYASSPWQKPITNPLSDTGTRWIESPSTMGLRFVGYADDLAKLDHTGWFTNDHEDKIRGCVYRLPGRNGRARFVAAHDNTDNGAADSDGPAYVDFSQIIESDFEAEMRDALRTMGKHYHTPERLKPGYWAEAAHETARREAARAADGFTERQAEDERDHNRAWEAGRMWQETTEEIQEIRESVKAELAQFKAARATLGNDPAKPVDIVNESAWRMFEESRFERLCGIIRASIASSLARVQELRDKRDKLASGDYQERGLFLGFYPSDELRAAFNDGAGKAVL